MSSFSSSARNASESDAKEKAQSITRKAQQLYNDACETASRTTDRVTGQIRNNPVQSSFLALGIGYILGRLFSR
ncbi:MAG: hypothetical protein KGJ06_06370 [Pseudomonadota bacterium]|nr:hypothetical protein [Pseudomonadota bacterium]